MTTRPPQGRPQGNRTRRLATDPLVPAVLLVTVGAVAAWAGSSALTWAALGGIAGYALSGSV